MVVISAMVEKELAESNAGVHKIAPSSSDILQNTRASKLVRVEYSLRFWCEHTVRCSYDGFHSNLKSLEKCDRNGTSQPAPVCGPWVERGPSVHQ